MHAAKQRLTSNMSRKHIPGGISLSAITCITLLLAAATAGNVIPLKNGKSEDGRKAGLYDENDKVTILSVSNFNETVLNQNYSILVEFYNTFCGHCQRYAPRYKALAERLYGWRDTLLVAAIDCNAFENTGICRDYEIIAYPTLRYFSPGYVFKEGNYGQDVDPHVELHQLAADMAHRLAAENGTANLPHFNSLRSVTENEVASLFNGLDSKRKFLVLVYEPENSTVGLESILAFQLWPDIQVRRVNDLHIANKFQIDGERYRIATVDRQGQVVPYSASADSTEGYVATIESFLNSQHFKPRSTSTAHEQLNLMRPDSNKNEHTQIINEVLRNKHFVYQADLEMAIRQMLSNEISKVHEIQGDKLLALQRILGILQRYNPLGANGREIITRLQQFVLQANESLSGSEFQAELERLERQLGPMYAASHFVGCTGSERNRRGYTCSLWTLFHFLTVQANRLELSQDPLEVLTAIHGYVKYFFGCTHCSVHFQEMAARRKIWNVPNKEEAVLWLWAAHNEVNQRLAGDETEDPQFPKIQFPSESSCTQCRKVSTGASENLDINWDKDAVFHFLQNIHNPQYISRFGLDNDALLEPTLEKLRQKRMIGNMFTDIDMRMGMLLYGFCIVMMVMAFKLFALKGYRKKPYGHDVLGKV